MEGESAHFHLDNSRCIQFVYIGLCEAQVLRTQLATQAVPDAHIKYMYMYTERGVGKESITNAILCIQDIKFRRWGRAKGSSIQ